MDAVTVGQGPLEPVAVVAVSRYGAQLTLDPDALAAVAATRRHVEALAASDRPVYGVSTGFGALATRHIPAAARTQVAAMANSSAPMSTMRPRNACFRSIAPCQRPIA